MLLRLVTVQINHEVKIRFFLLRIFLAMKPYNILGHWIEIFQAGFLEKFLFVESTYLRGHILVLFYHTLTLGNFFSKKSFIKPVIPFFLVSLYETG